MASTLTDPDTAPVDLAYPDLACPDLACPDLGDRDLGDRGPGCREPGCRELAGLSDEAVLDGIRAAEERSRLALAGQVGLIAEADRRRLAAGRFCGSTAVLVAQMLRVSRVEAKQRVRLAQRVLPHPRLTGTQVPAVYPLVGEVLACGVISVEQAATIVATLDRAPATVDAATREVTETVLVGVAAEHGPELLRRFATQVAERLDQDGPRPVDRLDPRRDLTLARRGDGSSRLSGWLTPDCAALLETVLDSLAKPQPDPNGSPDPRTPGQRRHDGLADAMRRLLREGGLPATGGIPATLLITATLTDLTDQTEPSPPRPPSAVALAGPAAAAECAAEAGTGAGTAAATQTNTGARTQDAPATSIGTEAQATVGTRTWQATATGAAARARWNTTTAMTGHGQPLGIRQAIDLLGSDGGVVSVLFNPHGGILDYGRTERLCPAPLRRAIDARDRGCTTPGCTIPAPWCEAHHVQPWTDGGHTSANNLALLCGFHHRYHQAAGWRAVMLNGVPHWTSPPHIDPTQTPKPNTWFHPERLHHPPTTRPPPHQTK